MTFVQHLPQKFLGGGLAPDIALSKFQRLEAKAKQDTPQISAVIALRVEQLLQREVDLYIPCPSRCPKSTESPGIVRHKSTVKTSDPARGEHNTGRTPQDRERTERGKWEEGANCPSELIVVDW
ncbi:hypothetical protein MMC10_003634 [Thelotrema lepadinum]|nr:hypothetical protein [Thelotrema lepadinum]